MFKILSVIVVLCITRYTVGELRWCHVTNTSSSPAGDGWIQFEDSSHSCVECSPDSVVLLEFSQVSQFECCNGKLIEVGNCEEIFSDESATCSNAIQVSVVTFVVL